MRYLVFISFLFSFQAVFGQPDKAWFGGVGDWDVAANWIPVGVPDDTTTVQIDSGEVTIQAVTSARARQVRVMENATLILEGALNIDGVSSFGMQNIGTFRNEGGELVIRNTIQTDAIWNTFDAVFINSGNIEVTDCSQDLFQNSGFFYNTGTGNVILANNKSNFGVGKGLINGDTLINEGNIEISGTDSDGIFVSGGVRFNPLDTFYAFFSNSGTITVDTGIGQNGLDIFQFARVENSGTLNIRSTERPFSGLYILTSNSSFENSGTLNINTAIQGDGIEVLGILRDSTDTTPEFLNTVTGVINISDTNCNGCGGSGIANQARFVNQGEINITQDSGFITLNGVENTLDGDFDNQGTLFIRGGLFGNMVNSGGATIRNTGRIEIARAENGFGSITNVGGSEFVNSGTLINNSRTPIQNKINAFLTNTDSIYSSWGLINEAFVRNEEAAVIQIDSGYVSNANPFGDDEAPIAEFLNQGTIRVQNSFYGIENRDLAFFTNEGLIDVKGVSSYGIYNTSFFNDSDTTLFTNSGTILIENTGRAGLYNFSGADFFNTGTVNIRNAGFEGIYNSFGPQTIFTNAGTINIAVTGTHGLYNVAPFTNSEAGTIWVSGFGGNGIQCFNDTLTNLGTLLVNTSISTEYAVKLRNPAIFQNQKGAFLRFQDLQHGGVELDGGTFSNLGEVTFGPNMGTEAVFGPDGAFVNQDSGILRGNGNIDSLVFSNAGFFKPGFSSPGSFRLEGNYDHTQAIFEYEIAGYAGAGLAGGNDLLKVQDTALLGGELEVKLIDGFQPAVGDTFLVMTCGAACVGRFDFVFYPSNPAFWDVLYEPNQVRIVYKGEPLSIDAGVDTLVCLGENAGLSALASGGDGNYTFTWDNGLGNGSDQLVSPITSTTYTVTVTDGINQTAQDTVRVLVIDNPTVTINGDLEICSGDTTRLDAGPFAIYNWSTNETTQGIRVSAAGLYSVRVTDANGCTASDTVTVTENPLPIPSISGDLIFCTGEAALLTVDSFPNISWSTNETTRSILVSTPGDYSVEVIDTNGCSNTDLVMVSESPLPTPAISGSLTLCPGSSTILDGGSFASYLWSTGDTTQTIEANAPGDYTLEVTNAEGCSGTAQVTLTQSTFLTPVIRGDSLICSDTSTILDAGLFDAYAWSNGAQTQTIEVNQSGLYSVIVTDVNGCIGTDSFELVVNPVPVLQIEGQLSLCEGQSTVLSAGIFDRYRWSTGETTPSITVNAGGSFSVEVTNAAGCTATASVEVSIDEAPQAFLSASGTSVCSGQTVSLFADGVGAFRWESPDGMVSVVGPEEAEGRPQSPSSTFFLIASNGCGEARDSIEIRILPAPDVTARADPESIQEGEVSQLSAEGASRFQWTGPGLSCVSCASPVASPSQTTSYQVVGTGTNGCKDSASVTLIVLPPDPTLPPDPEPIPPPSQLPTCDQVEAYNVITPNGDGANDALVFDGISDLSNSKLTIFNRWGTTVYESFDYQNNWTGTYDGQPLLAGTYLYILSLRSGNERCAINNTVTIIRP